MLVVVVEKKIMPGKTRIYYGDDIEKLLNIDIRGGRTKTKQCVNDSARDFIYDTRNKFINIWCFVVCFASFYVITR